MGIKKQTLLLILSCSFITLLLAGGVSLYGMFAIRSSAVEVAQEIGRAAADSSNEALREDIKRDLTRMLKGRSQQIDVILNNLRTSVVTLSKEMTTIRENPADYTHRSVQEPVAQNAGKIVPQLQYAPGVTTSDPALSEEVALTANIQDWLLRMRLDQDIIAGAYVASQNGFSITVDDRSEKKLDNAGVPLTVEQRARPWYQKAVAAGEPIFTDVFKDFYGDGLAITCAAPYYGPDGQTAGVVGAGMVLKRISQIVLGTKLGDTGFGFMIDREGRVLFSPKDSGAIRVQEDDTVSLFDAADESLATVAKAMASGESGLQEIMVDGVPCFLAYTPIKAMDSSYGIVIEVSEITAPIHDNEAVIGRTTDRLIDILTGSIRSTLMAVLALGLLFMLAVPFLSNRVADSFVKPIHLLADGVREIASGNLDKKLSIKTGNEIEHLAVCFNAMTDELQNQMDNLKKVTADKERIATELSVATNIQESMLPRVFPPFPERRDFDIYATMHAAKEVGGDFYDFYLLDENHLLVTIADVSGKGVPAALFMVIAKTILKNFALTMGGQDDLAPLVACTNDQLCQNNDAMMFVTAFVGLLDISTGRFNYVNAGHNPPLIYRKAEGKFSYLEVKRNFVMGGMDGLTFKGQELLLNPGDRLFLYTDGVTEALNEAEELYGEERLLSALNKGATENTSLKELLGTVRASLDEHVQSAPQSDDITMLALVYNGPVAKEV